MNERMRGRVSRGMKEKYACLCDRERCAHVRLHMCVGVRAFVRVSVKGSCLLECETSS